MKPIKTKELLKILSQHGFVWIRDGEHRVYAHGNVNVYIPHTREVSPGVTRQAFKAIKLVSHSQAVAA